MINFDIFKYNPIAAADFVAKHGECGECPMFENCDESPVHKPRGHREENKCFEMWEHYFVENLETLGSADDVAKVFGRMIDCDLCPVEKENECDYKYTKDCALTFLKWLSKDISTCQENRQVEEESDGVNHSDHYTLIYSVEVIDVINEILTRSNFTAIQGFYLGNVLKYILRADMKNGKEDYKKASVYLNWLIESM